MSTWEQARATLTAERLFATRLCFEAFLELIISATRPSRVSCVVKAKEHGFGMVGTFNTSTSTGSIGYYAKTIADAGLIAFCFAQSPEVRIAPVKTSS